MGYHIHHAIVCSSFVESHIQKAHEKAIQVFDPRLVSKITEPICNGFTSFLVAPDGSKEYWDTSTDYDDRRAEFCKWLDTSYREGVYVEYVEVAFGGDEPEIHTMVIRHSK